MAFSFYKRPTEFRPPCSTSFWTFRSKMVIGLKTASLKMRGDQRHLNLATENGSLPKEKAQQTAGPIQFDN